jgi:hypothetical protein
MPMVSVVGVGRGVEYRGPLHQIPRLEIDLDGAERPDRARGAVVERGTRHLALRWESVVSALKFTDKK